jgi:hypothetical protein
MLSNRHAPSYACELSCGAAALGHAALELRLAAEQLGREVLA